MEVYKELFKYATAIRDDGFDISYESIYDKNSLIAVYIYRVQSNGDRAVCAKLGYRVQLQNYHIALPSGRYQIKFFIKLKESARYFESLLTSIYELKVLYNFLPQILKQDNQKDVLSKLALNGLNDQDFKVVSAATGGAYGISPSSLQELSESALSLLKLKEYNSSTTSFLLNTIIYAGSLTFLSKNIDFLLYEIIKDRVNQKKEDILFQFGLLKYKTNNHYIAYRAFSDLLAYKNDLKFYQTGCISYLDSIETLNKISTIEPSSLISIYSIHEKKDYIGCVLVSCDYGYYKIYLEEQLKSLNEEYLIHIHFILPDNSNIKNIEEDLCNFINVNYSYEVMGDVKYSMRTYCSISRYIIVSDIISFYGLPVIVADADLDFNYLDIVGVFKDADCNSIYLRETKSDLPWFRVLAGFNVFGGESYDSSFLKVLKKYLLRCYYSGRDGWMLDQVALCQCLEFYKSSRSEADCNIYSLNDSFKINIKQVSNRVQKRLMLSSF